VRLESERIAWSKVFFQIISSDREEQFFPRFIVVAPTIRACACENSPRDWVSARAATVRVSRATTGPARKYERLARIEKVVAARKKEKSGLGGRTSNMPAALLIQAHLIHDFGTIAGRNAGRVLRYDHRGGIPRRRMGAGHGRFFTNPSSSRRVIRNIGVDRSRGGTPAGPASMAEFVDRPFFIARCMAADPLI